MLAIISTFRDFLDKIVPIATAEDLGALQDLKDSGELDRVVDMANTLKTLVDTFLPKVIGLGAAITVGMKPGVNVTPGTAVPNPAAWTGREFLHWRHPGRFASALVDRASKANDARFNAYALGYLCSFAGNVAGSPFVNSIVGGAYRPQWWRHRWVNNYVDSWVHGFYGAGATMSGDTPNPPYATWHGLCNAGLQQKIALGGIDPKDVMDRLRNGDPFPAVLPPEFASFWMDAFHDAYGTPVSRFRAEALNGAYVMTWMKLWFQTSGAVIGCNTPPPMTPPGDCGDKPPWVDPFTAKPGDNGDGTTPPTPRFEHDPDVAEVVSGIILALLGAASLFFGGGAAGVAAIAVGVGMIVDGELQFTWGDLRCDLYWYQQYLYNGLQVLHNLTTLGGFAHPYPAELAQDTTTLSLLGSPFKFDSGQRVVKSQARFTGSPVGGHEPSLGYPSKPWSGALGTWPNAPTASDPGWEQPPTTAYYTVAYPTFFVDDDAANPLTGADDVKTGGTWPPGFRPIPGDQRPVQFGNAVANAVDLIASGGKQLPDWNLDADRGMASLTWNFVANTYTDPVQVEQEQP
jgi:hypothetical protein